MRLYSGSMRSIALSLAALFASVSPTMAQSVAVTDHARSSLFAEMTGIAPGGTVRLALHQALEHGWHVYWKNPGDSGLPLETDWTAPQGAEVSPVEYPTPERIEIGPLVNYGHEGEPVFIATLTAPLDAAIGSSINVGLEATWLICAEICVPETGVFSLSLPVVATPDVNIDAAAVFSAADASRPRPARAAFRVHDGALSIRAEGIGADATGAYFFPEADNVFAPSAPQRFERREDGLVLTVSAKEFDRPVLIGVLLVETAEGAKGFAIDAGVDPTLEGAAAPAARNGKGAGGGVPPIGALPRLLLAAFVGGAILNLMPCVFPILFVKAASFAAAGADAGLMRRHGLLYAAGVVGAFAALGALLLMLRAAGEGLGWGFHLQSPMIVALSAYVLFAVGLNLAGAFSVGEGLQNVGTGLVASAKGDLAAFLTGVLAVVVAAPCVGPFLTAPIGAAALLAPASGMAIFVAMALGLAAPYVALSFSPMLARRLPKPGLWMDRFRQALAFPVFAAAAYFLWVLGAQTGGAGLAIGLGGLILLAFATRLWEWGRTSGWGRPAAAVALLAALAAALLLRPDNAIAAPGIEPATEAVAFDPADVERRRAAGEAIFIDFTAAWCVTCQLNKLTVLSSKKVVAAFEAADVTLVVADWTNRDTQIEKALAGYGANGIPLYVFYPSGGEAIVLPQPLTQSGLLALLTPKNQGD